MNLEDLYRLLRTGHLQAQGIVDTLDAPLVVLDAALTVVNANRAFFKQFRVDREETLGFPLTELGEGQWDLPELRTLLLEVIPKSQAVLGFEVTHHFPGLGVRTMTVSARRLAHPDDASANMLVVFEDVTDARYVAAQNDVVLAETRHRMKNLLATMQAIANLTRTEGRTAEEYKGAFLSRLRAMVEAQDLVLSGETAMDLEKLLRKATSPIAERVALASGPAVTLVRAQISPVIMIAHELATNAAKYGALSQEGGMVHVGWEVEQGADRRMLRLHWREQGGPRPNAAAKPGFGTHLIEFSAAELRGAAQIFLEPEGCRMELTFGVANEPGAP